MFTRSSQFIRYIIDISGYFGEWCNGSTTDSDSVCLGSNPSSPAKISLSKQWPKFITGSFKARLALQKLMAARSRGGMHPSSARVHPRNRRVPCDPQEGRRECRDARCTRGLVRKVREGDAHT